LQASAVSAGLGAAGLALGLREADGLALGLADGLADGDADGEADGDAEGLADGDGLCDGCVTTVPPDTSSAISSVMSFSSMFPSVRCHMQNGPRDCRVMRAPA